MEVERIATSDQTTSEPRKGSSGRRAVVLIKSSLMTLRCETHTSGSWRTVKSVNQEPGRHQSSH